MRPTIISTPKCWQFCAYSGSFEVPHLVTTSYQKHLCLHCLAFIVSIVIFQAFAGIINLSRKENQRVSDASNVLYGHNFQMTSRPVSKISITAVLTQLQLYLHAPLFSSRRKLPEHHSKSGLVLSAEYSGSGGNRKPVQAQHIRRPQRLQNTRRGDTKFSGDLYNEVFNMAIISLSRPRGRAICFDPVFHPVKKTPSCHIAKCIFNVHHLLRPAGS